MSDKYQDLVSDPGPKTPFDLSQDEWMNTEQGMETSELIGRLFHPGDVVRLSVTDKSSNTLHEGTLCAIEGAVENLQCSFEEIPGMLTALVGNWKENLSVSLEFNPVGSNTEKTGYPNAAIIVKGMDSADYKKLVTLIRTLRLPVIAILSGQITVMFVRVNASSEVEYDRHTGNLIEKMKNVDPEMEWTIKEPETTVPIPRINKDGIFYSICYPACGTPPVDEWSEAFFGTDIE